MESERGRREPAELSTLGHHMEETQTEASVDAVVVTSEVAGREIPVQTFQLLLTGIHMSEPHRVLSCRELSELS